MPKNKSFCPSGLGDCLLLGEGNMCVRDQSVTSQPLGNEGGGEGGYARQLVCGMVCPEDRLQGRCIGVGGVRQESWQWQRKKHR